MKLHFRYLTIFVALVALILTGCGLPHPGNSFYISSPADRTIYNLGRDIIIQYRTRNNLDLSGKNLEVVIVDNGTRIGRVSYPDGVTAASFTYQRPSAGSHILSAEARVINRDGSLSVSGTYDTQVICAFVGSPPSGSHYCQPLYGSFEAGLQAPPTITPTPNHMLASVQAYPSQVYYGPTCPSTLSTLTFRAALTLPGGTTPDQFQVNAHVGVRVGSSGATSGSLLVPLLSNGTWDAASGGQVFVGTLALTHSYNDANNQFDLGSLGTSSGAILWYATVSGNNSSGQNTELVRSPNQVVNLSPCPASGGILPHNPNKGNGSGTGSGTGSGSTTGSGSATGCGQYTNETSCNLGGCSWNPQSSACTVNQ